MLKQGEKSATAFDSSLIFAKAGHLYLGSVKRVDVKEGSLNLERKADANTCFGVDRKNVQGAIRWAPYA